MKNDLTELAYRLEACEAILESLQSEVSGFIPRDSAKYHTDAAIYGVIALIHDTMSSLLRIFERVDSKNG